MIYTAAHGGFASSAIPLGGGAAVSEQLVAEWTRRKPFDLQLLTPSILGSSAPSGRDLVRFTEREYAEFCYAFERAATDEILRNDPRQTIVLSNDISEGPDFARLRAAGFRVWTLWHVDVVAYIASIYLHSALSPAMLVRAARFARPLLPRLATLIFDKQRAAVECSAGHVVPSAGMSRIIRRCYPSTPLDRIRVLPWGAWAADPDPAALAAERERIRVEFDIPRNRPVVLTLSRISPEKGQDRLLRSLDEAVTIIICGEPAFMRGEAHFARLRSLASRMKRARVIFPGHVTGLSKQSFFSLADLYVFPSRYESYGLTLMEALRAGLPAVCADHAGASEIIRPEFGVIAQPRRLRRAILDLLSDAPRREAMSVAAREFARTQRFSDRAAVLASLLLASGKD